MGDIADELIEQGFYIWIDHRAGHQNFGGWCPYCNEEENMNELTMPFGKYKNKTLRWIIKNDVDYFMWLRSIELHGGLKQEVAKLTPLAQQTEAKKVQKINYDYNGAGYEDDGDPNDHPEDLDLPF